MMFKNREKTTKKVTEEIYEIENSPSKVSYISKRVNKSYKPDKYGELRSKKSLFKEQNELKYSMNIEEDVNRNQLKHQLSSSPKSTLTPKTKIKQFDR